MEKSDYTVSMRLLHYLALSIAPVARTSFELEQLIGNYRCESVASDPHVFISGLARAGTTLLLRRFHDTEKFRSLTYRDMPFPLMPGLWQRFSQPFATQLRQKERAHGDRILVDADSPEALDEVFWRVFSGKSYIKDDRLIPMRAGEETAERFRCYIASILSNEQQDQTKRYLSKNNNNILRLDSIRRAFPNSIIIVPFRDPLSHAASLLNQHKRFVSHNQSDKFAHDYMNMLAHHEFGTTHRPFIFDEETRQTLQALSPQSIDYWIALWIGTYRYLLDQGTPDNTVFLDYNHFCEDTDAIWNKFVNAADLPNNVHFTDEVSISKRTTKAVKCDVSNLLFNSAEGIYTRLLEREHASLALL